MRVRTIVVVTFSLVIALGVVALGQAGGENRYQGKDVRWWAAHAVQARKDANARRSVIVQLRRTLQHSPSVKEAVKLAAIVYPDFTPARAWRIMEHESLMVRDPAHAYNPEPVAGCHASGITQMLDGPSSCSTWKSTPYGRAGISVWSVYGQLLAAGWMHENGRGCEWRIAPLPSNCRR